MLPINTSLWPHTIRDAGLLTVKSLSDIRWNCDGTFIGCVCNDKSVKIGQLEVTGIIRSIHSVPCNNSVVQVCWHPSDASRFAVIGTDKAVELWDVCAASPVSKLVTLGHNINGAWAPNGQYLALGNKSENICIYDVREAKLIKKCKFIYEVNEFAWTANSDYLLVANANGESGFIDIMSFKNGDLVLLEVIRAHTSPAFCLKIDPTFRRMAVGSADTLVSLWDLSDLVCYKTLSGADAVRCVEFSADGEYIAIMCEGSSNILVFNCRTGETVANIDCKCLPVSMSWHPSQSLIAYVVNDRLDLDSERGRDKSQTSFLRLLSFGMAV